MSTDFAATKLRGPEVMGPFKVAKYKLQLPSSFTAAGESWDLSSDFDFVEKMDVGCGDDITDFEQVFNLIGTYSSSGEGMAADTIKLVAHWGGGADSELDSLDGDDISGVTNLIVHIYGS